jgi:hypothetical protein
MNEVGEVLVEEPLSDRTPRPTATTAMAAAKASSTLRLPGLGAVRPRLFTKNYLRCVFSLKYLRFAFVGANSQVLDRLTGTAHPGQLQEDRTERGACRGHAQRFDDMGALDGEPVDPVG